MPHYLAFSYNFHDSSVAIADSERVLLVLEAERYFGEKKKRCDRAEMETLVAAALSHCRLSIDQIEGVACTGYCNEHLPEDRRDLKWLNEQRVELGGRGFEALVVNHHLAHAAIVHAFDNPGEVAIDVCDGGGDFGDCHFIYRLHEGRLSQLPNQPIHDRFSSRFYDVLSRYIYGTIMCEGKLMALGSLGAPRDDMAAFIEDHLELFNALRLDELFATLGQRWPIESVTSQHAFDLAASAQRVFEELRVKSVAALPGDAPSVLLAGGGTLNILANTRVKSFLAEQGRKLLLPPCCDDTGQALGALLYYCHEKVGAKVTAAMPFLGYSDRLSESEPEVSEELVDYLASGGIVFLHRGQSEIGPRALGHRSILARPTRRSYDVINHIIKGREFYRPLAPLVPRDEVSHWFEWEDESEYMLYAAAARQATLLQAPGICHYDETARLQTVDAKDAFLHGLLKSTGKTLGCPILINTSLNPRGRPILSKLEETLAFARDLKSLKVRVFGAGGFLE